MPPRPSDGRARPRSFRLTRFFALSSLGGITAVTIVLILIYRVLTLDLLVHHEGSANADLTRVFANTTWTSYDRLVRADRIRTREELLADPLVSALRHDVLRTMKGLDIAKVKLYDRHGVTVFSTDPGQIGELKAGNGGFVSALAGVTASQITHRERFDAFEGTLNDRDLIASYIPLQLERGGPVEAVLEVYSDVTDHVELQRRTVWLIVGAVLAALTALYAFLTVVVRRADRIMAQQEHERAAQAEEIRFQAYHDALTGLPNRASFGERLGEVIGQSSRSGQTCALMFIDLDRFKIVNDSLGHEAGDQLLRDAAVRIKASLREGDRLFRMGGDEFTAILPQIGAPEVVAGVARRVQEQMAQPFVLRDHELRIGATLGIAVFPGDGDDAEALLRNADAAMYSAKAAGRGSYAFYQARMNQRALQRLDLEVALHKGFREGEFELYYQPRVDAASREVVAFEALLRWNRPGHGVLEPDAFVAVLEDAGMMPLVGEWVLRGACHQLAQWTQQGDPGLRIAVNVAAAQFRHPQFVSTVARVLRDTGIVAARLELEFGEGLLAQQAQAWQAAANGLHHLGARITIDEVGVTYAALDTLRKGPVDGLKIDHSVVRDIVTHDRDRATVAALAQLARTLGFVLGAEGVETEAQARVLSGIGCGELQGARFEPPLPAARATALLVRRRAVSLA